MAWLLSIWALQACEPARATKQAGPTPQWLTSHGLRSLTPDHPDYRGHPGGDRRTRDAAYHQGTVWGWLIGPFVSAHLRMYRDPALARSFLWTLIQAMDAHCVGSLTEISGRDPPFTPRGCIVQA